MSSPRNQHNTTSARSGKRASARPSVAAQRARDAEGVRMPMGGGNVVISRRRFLYGTLGVGAAATVAVGATLIGGNDDNDAPQGIDVPEDAVFNLDDCEEVPLDDCFTLIGEYELPYGALLWTNDDAIAACLLPTEEASPLTQVALLLLETGNYFTVLEEAVGTADGYEIYDVRANSQGLAWAEANVMQGTWRIFCATVSEDISIGEPVMVEEGDRTIETPTIGVVGDHVYWQVMPAIGSEDAYDGPSYLKRASFSKGDAQVLHQANGRMSCPLYAASAGVVICARSPESRSTFNVMYFGDDTGQVEDSLTLPRGMAPNALGFGPNGISFGFESIYDYGGGISNLGTYTPAKAHRIGDAYDGLSWFRFGRTPQAGPCWCSDQWLMVKSTTAVCGVDMAQRTFCSLDVRSGCADWGDYLATSGAGGTVTTIMQIDQVNTQGATEHYALVRVWQPYGGPAHTDEDQDGYDDYTGELLESAWT